MPDCDSLIKVNGQTDSCRRCQKAEPRFQASDSLYSLRLRFFPVCLLFFPAFLHQPAAVERSVGRRAVVKQRVHIDDRKIHQIFNAVKLQQKRRQSGHPVFQQGIENRRQGNEKNQLIHIPENRIIGKVEHRLRHHGNAEFHCSFIGKPGQKRNLPSQSVTGVVEKVPQQIGNQHSSDSSLHLRNHILKGAVPIELVSGNHKKSRHSHRPQHVRQDMFKGPYRPSSRRGGGERQKHICIIAVNHHHHKAEKKGGKAHLVAKLLLTQIYILLSCLQICLKITAARKTAAPVWISKTPGLLSSHVP